MINTANIISLTINKSQLIISLLWIHYGCFAQII